MKRKSLVSLAASSILISSVFSCGTEETIESFNNEHGSVPGEFVLRLGKFWRNKLDAVQSSMTSLDPTGEAKLVKRFSGDDDEFGDGQKLSDLLSIDFPTTGIAEANKQIFNSLQNMESDGSKFFDLVDTNKFASTDVLTLQEISNDPQVKNQYYLEMIKHKDALELEFVKERLKKAPPIVVAVADTGVYADHEDLKNVMWSFGGNQGYNALDKKTVKSASDDQGHGTHVAGIIAADGSNSKGITGVGFSKSRGENADQYLTEIMSIKVLNKDGGGTSDAIEVGLKWAIDQHTAQKKENGRENQKLVINMSLGGPFDADGLNFKKDDDGRIISDIFEYAKTKDVLIIAAAGNDTCKIGDYCRIAGNDYEKAFYYPCSYSNVFCVASTDSLDKVSNFSNRAKFIRISAPGSKVLSTVNSGSSNYEYWDGTSMAAPVTAGAAAMIWGLYPEFSAKQIREILRLSSSKVSDVTNKITSGDGRLDMKAALSFAEELSPTSELGSNNTPKDPKTLEPTTDDGSASASNPPPENPSSSQGNGKSSSTKKKGGCGIIEGNGSSSVWLMLALLILPIFVRQRRTNVH